MANKESKKWMMIDAGDLILDRINKICRMLERKHGLQFIEDFDLGEGSELIIKKELWEKVKDDYEKLQNKYAVTYF